MLKISPPSDLFPLVRSHSVSSQSLRSPLIFAGDGSAVAAYPEIRRQANLSASPRPFRLPPSLPHTRHFSLAARSVAAYPKDSPSGESPRLAVPVPPPAIPSPFPPNLPLPAPFVGGAKRRRVSKRFAVRRISPLWLGRIVKEGAGPLLDTPAPLPRPAFPATLIHPRGRVSGGGLPSRLPIVPGGFAGGHGAISAFLPEPPSPALFAPAAPSVLPPPGTAEIASF